MFPTILLSFILTLAILGALAIKHDWLHGKPMTDEETVQRYLEREKGAKRLEAFVRYITFPLTVISLFIFLYWTFGRFIMWAYYLFS